MKVFEITDPYKGARIAVPATFEIYPLSGQEKRRKKRKEKRNKK